MNIKNAETFQNITINELKDLLFTYISPFKDMVITTPTQEFNLSKAKSIKLLLKQLSKDQLKELILQLELLQSKNMKDTMYLKYILTAILFTL
ncbi:hypothetical protein [Bacillus sp. V5-8f]|uniref:hypothetical protein n=1 Tax=Bacillus sp. V5-8f TaxID=2053044 RepID=UPI000C76686B|nr:hypothetical protein [Bacillus sp. V5-8f]PLT33503.1 hypothetical protein CUU64_13080 [Bacillus sp. V5-8f]